MLLGVALLDVAQPDDALQQRQQRLSARDKVALSCVRRLG